MDERARAGNERVGVGVALAGMRGWPARRWLTAAAVAAGFTLAVAVPTDLIDTAVFSREIPPTWWAWPALLASSVLAGLVVATYVRVPGEPVAADGAEGDGPDRSATRGWIGGTLTFFAVGCPVCNKLVLVLLGTSGALTWFEPLQPLLQVAAVGLLGWALLTRLRGDVLCPVGPGGRAGAEASLPR
ncbi:hypothetical protein [Nocardioides sp. YIM 152588]|uniref:hypothetical protein n=1 Tax=Nocardioides sp. YIM 152588 TaxID=3158259 RepID=UPI0032E40098